MTTIYYYLKKDGTTRNITVDPSKIEEFTPACREYFIDDLTGTSLAWRRSQPVIHTHMRVWDIENEGWRTLIMDNIINTKTVCISDTFYNSDETVEGEEILIN